LDPSGVLTITLERSDKIIADAIRNVLLPLETGS